MRPIRYLFVACAIAMTPGVAIGDTPSASTRSAIMTEKTSATATVRNVDTERRRLTLEDDQGKQFTVDVPEEVKRLAEIKPGDTVKVDYYESIGLALEKRAAGAQPSAKETTLTKREASKLPAGLMIRKTTATAQVMEVDRAKNKVTIKGPRGETHTFTVTDPDLKDDLGKLQKGDTIEASYTEAIAVAVERPEKVEQKQRAPRY